MAIFIELCFSHTVFSTWVDLLYPQITWKLRTEKFNGVQLRKGLFCTLAQGMKICSHHLSWKVLKILQDQVLNVNKYWRASCPCQIAFSQFWNTKELPVEWKQSKHNVNKMGNTRHMPNSFTLNISKEMKILA